MISSALKTLDPHKDDASCAPVLGRVLTLAGYANFHAQQAVTAEGLIRSASERLQGKYASNDTRCVASQKDCVCACFPPLSPLAT
jgi:hypothetical protein